MNRGPAISWRSATFALVLVVTGVAPAATRGTTEIRDLTWDRDDARGLTRVGRITLEMEGVEWRHAESEHFVYHFVRSWMAERAAGEAETFYSAVKRDLKVEEDRWEKKAHLFLFETVDSWRAFVEKFGVDRWSGGLCNGTEIFALAPPRANPFTGIVLPHEMAHLVVNRFVRGQLPVWLSEGFAEQQARRHFAAYTKPKGYRFILSPTVVAPDAWIPLAELAAAGSYPEDTARVVAFYAESARLVQLLVEDHPDCSFLDFLQALADGARFETALDRVYGRHYRNIGVFEEKFREVAISKVKFLGEKTIIK